MSKSICLAFLLILCSLYFSKAQDVQILDARGNPLEGAWVTYISQSDNKVIRIVSSDKTGLARILNPVFPLKREISLLGFQPRLDTLLSPQPMIRIDLISSPVQMGEVTVTGNYASGSQRNNVVPVQVLNRSDFEKRGAVTVKDLLSQELNMQVNIDPALGSSLTLQGTGGEHIKVLVDGVPVIGRMNGNIDLTQLNLNQVERVELVKGPMSVLYGTDALGGIINIITRNPAKQHFSGGLSTFLESSGQYNFDAQMGWGFKNTGVTISGGRNFFDGYDPVDADSRSQLWNPREQLFSQFKLTHSFRNIKIGFLSSWFDEKVNNKAEPVITPYFAYANDQVYRTLRFNNQLNIESRLSSRSSLTVMSAYSHYRYIKNTYRKNLVDLSEQLTSEQLDDDTTQFNAVFGRAMYVLEGKDKRWNAMAGMEVNNEMGDGRRIGGGAFYTTDVALFTGAEYKPVEKLTIRPSVRFIYNSRFSAPVIPSLNLLYKASDRLTLRGSVSLGYRAPSLKELFLYFVDNGLHNVQGNSDLQAETSRQLLLSGEYRLPLSKSVLTLEPSLFMNYIYDRISLVQFSESSTLFTYVNLDRFRSKGAEFRARMAFSALTLSAGAAYTGAWATFGGDVEQPETAWYPELNASVDYKFDKTKTLITVFWKHFGQRPVFVTNMEGQLKQFDNQAFSFLDATISQKVCKDRLNISLGVRNILNVTNIQAMNAGGIHSNAGAADAPVAMGRTLFTRITYTIK